MADETLYACLDSVVRGQLMQVRFRHSVTNHIYQIEGVEYSLRDRNALLFRAFDMDDKKYVHFSPAHLRLLEKVPVGEVRERQLTRPCDS